MDATNGLNINFLTNQNYTTYIHQSKFHGVPTYYIGLVIGSNPPSISLALLYINVELTA